MKPRRGGDADLDWLQPDNFGDEPIYCATDEIPIYSGSEDEEYGGASIRRKRYEEQARRYLQGKPTTILSARLRGPFSTSSWQNPWLVKRSDLPAESRKFGRHFAAATRKQQQQQQQQQHSCPRPPLNCQGVRSRLLPSESQQTCGSPAVGAMAEAFQDADDQARRHQEALERAMTAQALDWVEGDPVEREPPNPLASSPVNSNFLFSAALLVEDEPIAEVSEVLDNLDDFLNSLDANVEELAGREAKRRKRESGRFSDAGLGGLGDAADLMDVGVWDS
ncbi:hypothetical protein P8C59_006292 [Phyllachora maydis]|uniref:Uncharacterized protein n=1 Tax=Phyllachora maydis TaxID=1825666 RepID=A0AAD9I7X4_9PEZI|nr:hypothetical protein P8C59_006292 [Phyllachora maydis]